MPKFSLGKAIVFTCSQSGVSPYGPNGNLILFMAATAFITIRHMHLNSEITATYKLLTNNSLQVRATKQIKKNRHNVIHSFIYLLIYCFSVR